MITKDELRRIVALSVLSDAMLEKIVPLAERLNFGERERIFKEGYAAETFFMLLRGKVLLEQRISEHVTVSMDAIKPGYSFGWSAMLGGGIEPYSAYTSDAFCVEASEVLALPGEEFQELLESDHTMGYLIGRRLIRVIKQRLVYRTEQFVRIIKKHPDIEGLIL